jgi:predicted alpha/beta-fold hydrolase
MEDGLDIVDHIVKNYLGENKLMVHGDSLGGMVANYVARHEKVSMLFANRTFASLNTVGFWAAGN